MKQNLTKKTKRFKKKDRVIRKQEQELKEKDVKFVLYLFKHDISMNEIAETDGEKRYWLFVRRLIS